MQGEYNFFCIKVKIIVDKDLMQGAYRADENALLKGSRQMARLDKLLKHAAELRALLADQDDIEIAEHYGIRVENLDMPDGRLGYRSVREDAQEQIEKWGKL